MEIVFYQTQNGRRPVETELLKLDRDNRAKVLAHLDFLEKNEKTLKEPHVKYLGDGLKELRTSIHPGQYRVVYFLQLKEEIVLLHSFKKKTQKTPKKDLDLAKKRMKDWKGRHEK
jgi:phage-related protein